MSARQAMAAVRECSAAIPYTTFPTIDLGVVELRTFGLVVAIGVLIGAWLAARYGEEHDIPRDVTYSLAMRMVVAGVIGSRITWVLTHLDDLDSPWEAFAIWQGGLQFSGGFVFARDRGLPRVPPLEPAHPLAQPRRLRLRPGHRPRDRSHRLLRGGGALRAR